MFRSSDLEAILDKLYFGASHRTDWHDALCDLARRVEAKGIHSCQFANGAVRNLRLHMPGKDESASSEHDYIEDLLKAMIAEPGSGPVLHLDREDLPRRIALPASGRSGDLFLLDHVGEGFTDERIGELREIAPHLLRAARLRASVEETASLARSTSALLDLMGTPVFIVDGQCRVILANSAARAVRQQGIVRLRDGFISFPTRKSTERVNRAVARIAEDTEDGEETKCLVGLEMPDGESHLAVVVPLDAEPGPEPSFPKQAAAAIFIRDPSRPIPSTEAVLRELHGMPRAEARLARAIAEGKTLKEYASEENLSEGYVRDLSKRTMSRLGVSRQPDLVRAIFRIVPEIGV